MSSLYLLYQGSQIAITAFGEDDGRCEVREFLENRQALAAADEQSLQDLFIRHGDHGQIRDQGKCRHLDDGIWEYKARHGGRIAWFYVLGALVICACGVVKKKDKADPAFIRRAMAVRERFLSECEHGQVHRDF